MKGSFGHAKPTVTPTKRFLTAADLPSKGVHFSSSYLRKLWSEGKFPKPIKISARKLAWDEAVIDAWIDTKLTANRPPQVAAQRAAEAKRALTRAKQAMPQLTAEGIGAWVNARYVYSGEVFERERRDEAFVLAEIATAIAFLRLRVPTKHPNVSSYGLKHSAENWGAANGMAPYITNGALIVAAHFLKFTIQLLPRSPNVMIGVNRNSLKELEPGSRTREVHHQVDHQQEGGVA